MNEGEQLKAFIDSQPVPKLRIAQDLGMTKQNLYGLFKSIRLSPENKAKFEAYFGKTIFMANNRFEGSHGAANRNGSHLTNSSMNSHTEEYIQSLQKMIQLLEDQCSSLKSEILENQRVQQAQLKALSVAVVRKWAAGDKKKETQELQAINTLVAEFSK